MQTKAADNKSGFFTPEQEAQQERDYCAMLIKRYRADLPMSRADRREALAAIRRQKAFEKQRSKMDSISSRRGA